MPSRTKKKEHLKTDALLAEGSHSDDLSSSGYDFLPYESPFKNVELDLLNQRFDDYFIKPNLYIIN